jgi:hypothetical protein
MAPPPYISSVPASVLRAQRDEPPWRFRRTTTVREAKQGLEFPIELVFQVIGTEPEIGAIVVRPASWRGKRIANYLAPHRNGLLVKEAQPERALAFRIYLAFPAPGPYRIPYPDADGSVPLARDNLLIDTNELPFVDNRIADLGLAVTGCFDNFAYHYQALREGEHMFAHVDGSGWIQDPIGAGPYPTASHALLLLARGFDLQLALAPSSPLPQPGNGQIVMPTAPVPSPPPLDWYCPPGYRPVA